MMSLYFILHVFEYIFIIILALLGWDFNIVDFIINFQIYFDVNRVSYQNFTYYHENENNKVECSYNIIVLSKIGYSYNINIVGGFHVW